ncbi:hypothetical protein CPLU01_01780 [Colletotrichum plurivorum]|uniref:Uncharacterized protein n=1 Tax=Colletotrichum plurivorum TaxID=2175906 RepID=A0A8H6NNJ8_9PEZI|nr:hypothetical protein CPLU01_01780 [Colletotrichum plurivorum]
MLFSPELTNKMKARLPTHPPFPRFPRPQEPPPMGDDHRDAVHGNRLPTDLENDYRLKFCVIHGIRHNDAFARSDAVAKLCSESDDRVFARARNARLIMSNTVPEMESDEDKPYCIWYPELATEDTYRELAKRYPDLRYLVGRACAVAGYADLYEELDLLPEVSIAEEARDNSSNEGSKAIFDSMMGKPVCYRVLDDYTRSCHVDDPTCPAFMNGDTAVRSSLDVRHGFELWKSSGDHYFNIAEDRNVDEVSSEKTNVEAVAPEHVELFYTPLLSHLPTTNKDALILMAAYEGNIERYARLRRPQMICDEYEAVIRGIYHNTTFARWWWGQKDHNSGIATAAVARFIMVNDLSHVTPSIPGLYSMPDLIWWPLIPEEETLRELNRRRPDMHLQVAMACIAGDYRNLWDELSPDPCSELWIQAEHKQTRHFPNSPSRNYYTEHMERRAKEMGLKITSLPGSSSEVEDAAECNKEPGTTWLDDTIYAGGDLKPLVGSYPDTCFYPGMITQPNAGSWELYICSSEGMRRYARLEQGVRLYDEEFVAAFPFYHENDRHSWKGREIDAWELPEKYLPAK